MNTWRLQDWWQWLLRHWWVGVPLMVAGAVLGAVLTRWVFPTPYWAESVFVVGYNADTVMHYPEDYKNWMLTELDGFVQSERVLQPVLDTLPDDPYWQHWQINDLAAHLQTRWFNAGQWHLHAQADTAAHARTLAAVWGAVALREIRAAIAQGEAFREADARWQQLESRRQQAETARAAIQRAQEALQAWLTQWQAGKGVPLTEAQRAELRYWASFALLPTGGTVAPLPAADAPASAYADWAERVLAQLRAADQVWQHEAETLLREQAAVAAQRQQALALSAGISSEWQVALAAEMPGAEALEAHEPALWANLTAEGSGLQPVPQPVYSWKDGAAVGAFVGLVVWLALALLAALLRGERERLEGDSDA